MTIQRNWINAPSGADLFRYLHRTRVLVDSNDSEVVGDTTTGPYVRYRAYFLEGNVTSTMVDSRCLASGWPLETYAQHPFSGKRSY